MFKHGLGRGIEPTIYYNELKSDIKFFIPNPNLYLVCGDKSKCNVLLNKFHYEVQIITVNNNSSYIIFNIQSTFFNS